MKLNYRDKVILIGVLVALVWVAGIMLFVKPAIESVNKTQNSLDKKTTELAALKKELEEQKDLPERINKAYSEVEEISKNFYDYQSAQTATHTIDKLLSDAGLDNKNMSISEYQNMTLSAFTYVDPTQSTLLDNKVDQYATGEEVQDVDTKSTAVTKADAKELINNLDEKTGTADIVIGYYDVDFTFTANDVDKVKTFCQNLVSGTSLLVYNLNLPDVTSMNDKETENTLTLKMVVVKKLQNPKEIEDSDAANASEEASAS